MIGVGRPRATAALLAAAVAIALSGCGAASTAQRVASRGHAATGKTVSARVSAEVSAHGSAKYAPLPCGPSAAYTERLIKRWLKEHNTLSGKAIARTVCEKHG